MKTTFLTSAHSPFDDRIFHHQAKSFIAQGDEVEIVSSTGELNKVVDGVTLNCFNGDQLPKREKINVFFDKLEQGNPDVVICSEPIPLVAARQYQKKFSSKAKIVYDITEWYPSKKNLAGFPFPVKWFQFIKLLFFNFWVSFYADAFLFGEHYKSKPYKFLYPRKPFAFLGYYPDLKYIPYKEPSLQKDTLRFSYSGKISLEKGFGNFVEVLRILSDRNHRLKIDLKIIGWFDDKDESHCRQLLTNLSHNINVKYYERQKFTDFLELISDSDFFLDLRSDDFENQRCLPIKLFYYAALGRPVIFPELKAIRKEVEIDKFGYLVKPHDSKHIAHLISKYINNPGLYTSHCKNARLLVETNYNWQRIEPVFVRFIKTLQGQLSK
ncbi:MAG: glycosyltransferase [Bacteroidales bacterium]|nr:glycosyltransferase [Bacteroidales bacterium]MCF8458479.1 glycosyltransferase [Bacteroidales bacterium]